MMIPFHVFDPNEFMNRTQKYVRWIWRLPTVLVALAMSALATAVIVQHFGTIWAETLDLYAFLRKPFWDAVQFFVILCFIGLIHEMAHGSSCKFYGGDVHDIGAALLYLMSGLHSDTTDALLFQASRTALGVVCRHVHEAHHLCDRDRGCGWPLIRTRLLHEFAYKADALHRGLDDLFQRRSASTRSTATTPWRATSRSPSCARIRSPTSGPSSSATCCGSMWRSRSLSRRKRRIFLDLRAAGDRLSWS